MSASTHDDTTSRLQAIQRDLAAILEARLSELTEAMKNTELVTRRIVAAEIELERHRASQDQLSGDLGSLEDEVRAARARAEEVRGTHAQLAQARDQSRAELQRIEREVADIDAEVEQSRQRARELENTAETLRRENAALKVKLKTLEENVARMRQLQKELMSSMSDLTQQMTSVASGEKA